VRVSPLAPAPIEPAPAPQQPVVAPYDTGAAKTELPVIGKQGRAHKSLLAAVIGLAAIAGAGYLATRGAPGSTISESRDTDNQPTLNSAAPFTENLNGVRLEMAPVPSGSFLMGSPESEKGRYGDEGPQHRVTVSGFYIGRYEVTQAQWQAVMGANPANFKGDDDLPVERVSWSGAKEFCVKLSRITGKTYRLPSEAEWEYACRAGTTDPYAGDLDALAWYSNNSGNKTHPVGQKQANAFGLFDMHGNVWEWCEDISHGGYGRQHGNPPMDGSAWLSDGNPSARVLRGGSFNYNDKSCRSASRNGASDDRYVNAGFRVVVSARTQ
jgi:formylglycine-generating enzyme required for sulfatase activity